MIKLPIYNIKKTKLILNSIGDILSLDKNVVDFLAVA